MKHPNQTSEKKAHVNQKLLRYSSAAGAAIALANSADAGIMEVDVTGWSLQLSAANESLDFTTDLNGDSVNDFTFFGTRSQGVFGYTYNTTLGGTTYITTGSFAYGTFSIQRINPANAVAQDSVGDVRTLAPGSGVVPALGAGQGGGGIFLTTSFYSGAGSFNPASGDSFTGLIGLSFDISGNTHYAWLEVLVSRDISGRPETLEVLSGAYETTAGVDIAAGAIPEPASVGTGLGLLALGAAGLRRMRSESRK